VKLLGEFLMQMASESSTDPCDGVYLPKGAVHLLGTNTYEQVLKKNNFFLDNVATILVNMEYKAWFAVIDPKNQSETERYRFMNTSSANLGFCDSSQSTEKMHHCDDTIQFIRSSKMYDEHLQLLIRKSIPPGIEPLAALLPH